MHMKWTMLFVCGISGIFASLNGPSTPSEYMLPATLPGYTTVRVLRQSQPERFDLYVLRDSQCAAPVLAVAAPSPEIPGLVRFQAGIRDGGAYLYDQKVTEHYPSVRATWERSRAALIRLWNPAQPDPVPWFVLPLGPCGVRNI